jgi:hypothetical protein
LPLETAEVIITNPPWGAEIHAAPNSKEDIFSHFLIKSLLFVKSIRGEMKFVLPYSFLNIKKHQQVRKLLIDGGFIKSIRIFDTEFSGVMTKCVVVTLRKDFQKPTVIKVYHEKDVSHVHTIDVEQIKRSKNYNITIMEKIDEEILKHVKERCSYTLENSDWGLGIVTGNNKKFLSSTQTEGYEPIITGKDIMPLEVDVPRKYIKYYRDEFQQAAPDSIYRQKPKLVYKFISNKLVFAVDYLGQLVLNSANILIPNIPDMDIHVVCALLNSELYQYMYSLMFDDIKILRGNLEQLPFPNMRTQHYDFHKMIMTTNKSRTNHLKQLNGWIYSYFNIPYEWECHIKNKIK